MLVVVWYCGYECNSRCTNVEDFMPCPSFSTFSAFSLEALVFQVQKKQVQKVEQLLVDREDCM